MVWCGLLTALGCAVALPVCAAPNAELISVDFVSPGTGGDGSGNTGPCVGDTVLTGTTMNNAVGNIYSGQTGAWNPLNIGTYNNSSAITGFLTNGSGTVTTAKLALGLATGLNTTLAGYWRCDPNAGGTSGAVQQLRSESAYLYNGVITGDHYAWAFTGLIPNALYNMTFYGDQGNPSGASNVANGVAGSRDTEGDWNWTNITADSSGTILGTFTAPQPTLGLYGAQLQHIPRTQPPQTAPSVPQPVNGASNVPTWTSLNWSNCVGAETYDVYLWPTSGSQPATPSATVTTGQYTPSGFLVPLTGYSWQVIARNAAGGTNGPVWTFTTDDGRPLAPAMPSPANGATNVLVETALDWADSARADGYQVYVWISGNSQPATPTTNVVTSACQPAATLTGNVTYNWQIVATNSYGSTTGAVWTFTTGDPYPGYLVPWPASVTMRSGNFPVTASTRIVAANASLLRLAAVMANDFYMAAGLRLTALQGTAQAGDIFLTTNTSLSGEAYTLDVSSANIVLSGSNYQAVAWASVTLLQALNTSASPATVPQMLIQDQPASPLRTVMWDIGRFFHPLQTLYELVDLHRMYKVTYMHLYMSANGLFTFGTAAYPALTNNNVSSGSSSAGFYVPPAGSRLYYTKAELTNLVQYATDRGVIIVPEIDTPAWAGYMTGTDPADFCSVGGATGTGYINLNYTNAMTAMAVLMGELADVFHTSPYIHIGADETDTSAFTTYPYWAQNAALNNLANGGEAMVWYMNQLSTNAAYRGKTTWAWSAPGKVGKGYDMPTNMVFTAWGSDDGQYASHGGYWVMRAAGGHVAGYGQINRPAPYNRCLLYRPAEGIYNRLMPLLRYISYPDNDYTDLSPTNDWVPITGTENKILGAHIMEWETPYELEVPAMRLSMPALGEPTWNQGSSQRLNWDNFLARQTRTDQLYQRVMRPVVLSVTTEVDPKDICFMAGGMVTMTSAVPGTIRYTVGTDYNNSWYNFPTTNSTAYSGPFAITQSSVISARLFDSNGNPLGNPVTRGFYLITPTTHYKYYFTGDPAPAGFESGTPIVSSVMGQMDGDAPQEDVRFGDSLHRTIYSGSLTAPSSGAYTFTASFGGGAITIDRAPVTDGVPVTLTAGEHLFKIVTPPAGWGTPYTFTGPGYGSPTDLNVLLKTLATASQVFPASYAFGTQGVSDGATAKQEVTIVNHNVFTNLVITSVQLTGANASEFVLSADTGETVLAPGYERIVGVQFDPATVGAKTALLHVVAAGLPGGYADVTLTGTGQLTSTAPPSTPAMPVPADGTTGVSVTTKLDWADSTNAAGYQLWLWPATGSKPVTPNATLAASQWTPPASLPYSTAYNWQVVATNIYGTTAGAVWSFTTAALQPPSTPITPAPANGATNVSVGAVLDWADSTNAAGYQVWLWLTSVAKPATPTATVAASQWAPLANLLYGSNYNWQVVATNIAGSTPGALWSFHVGATVAVTNLANGTTLRYPLALMAGTYDGTALQITAAPTNAAVSLTTYGTRFRCLVDMQPGTNVLTMTDGHGPTTFSLVYAPATATQYRYKVWYVVPSDEAFSPVDPNWFVHFGLQTKLMQSWMAEDQLRAGNGRATFYPEMDASNNVNVAMLVVSETRAQAEAAGTGMYGEVWNQLPAAYKDGFHKNIVFSSVAFNALGGGDLAYVGAYTNIHPNRIADMMGALLSTKVGNDGSLTYATYNGVTLHEICHTINNIWHDTSPNDIMGGGGYDISEYFTLTYSTANPTPHNESSAGTLSNQRDLASWCRYLMSADPQTYNNTTVGVSAGPEYLTASSAYPLAVFQYYIPETAADLHTNLWTSGVTVFSKHAGRARLELGGTPFNIMAVDTQGNSSYTTFSGSATVPVVPVDDSYTVNAAGATVIAVPGVLGNDINPSGSTLTAVLATNVQHGTLSLSANGGFTYTPASGYTGTDTFWYKAADAVSSDQQARVTITVPAFTASAGPPQTVTPTVPSIQIGGSPTAIGGSPPYTYSWAPTTGLSSATVANPTATPSVTTTYTVTVTDSLGAHASDTVVVTYMPPNAALISVDFVVGGSGGDGSGHTAPCSGDTVLTGTTMNNVVGNVFFGQAGSWNPLNIGTYSAGSAISGFLTNGAGAVTAVKMALGQATELSSTLAGNYRCDPNEGTPGTVQQLRSTSAYLYYPTLTADHYAWAFTGLTPNAHYRLTLFGNGSSTFSNIANAVAGIPDSEGDWNWSDIAANASGVILGTLTTTGNNQTYGLYGAQIEALTTVVLPPPVLPLSGFSRPGGVPTFDIPNSILSSQYALLYKDHLTDPAWTALTGSGAGIGNGGTLRLSDPTPVNLPEGETGGLPAERFYRLMRNP